MDGAGYHVFDHLPVAKRVVQIFQQHLPFHSRGLAVQEVIARLAEGETEQALSTAAVTYARWVRACKKELRYCCSATTFYSLGGEWERFRAGELPEVPDERTPAQKRADAQAAERQANMNVTRRVQQTPEEREEARQRWFELRRGIGGMP